MLQERASSSLRHEASRRLARAIGSQVGGEQPPRGEAWPQARPSTFGRSAAGTATSCDRGGGSVLDAGGERGTRMAPAAGATMTPAEIAATTARILIETQAIQFNAAKPFTFASGLASPTYCDCRKLISFRAPAPSSRR